jgi:hypothetical protein
MELLPEDFRVAGLRVEYRVAAKLGDVLVPTVYQIDGGMIVSLSVGDQVSAIIEFSRGGGISTKNIGKRKGWSCPKRY